MALTVKFKMKSSVWWTCLGVLVILSAAAECYRINSSTLTFEMCSPYDSELELKSVKISSCSVSPCNIPIGQYVKLTATFYYHGERNIVLTHQPNWFLNYIYTPATMTPDSNDYLSPKEFSFIATIYVNDTLPPLRGSINWRLLDENQVRTACYNIPVQLVF